MKGIYLLLPVCFLTMINSLSPTTAQAQTHTCPAMVSRNNGNGSSTTCPGVNGTGISTCVYGTSFASVPTGSKTADITLKGENTDAWYTNPPAIYVVYTTSGSTSTTINTYPGPPGVPSSGSVKYCSYTGASGNGNMPNAGIVSFRFVTPTNISDYLVCSYDFSNANALVANPSTITALPVHFYHFDATVINKSVNLSWTSSRDRNTREFVVERSVNGADYTNLATIQAGAAAGDNDVAGYSYDDYSAGNLNAHRLYYRIREADYSGTITYSSVNTVTLADDGKDLDMAIQGNMLVIKSGNTPALLQYINIEGRVIKEEKLALNNGTTSISLGDANRTSFVRLVAGRQVAVCRM